MSGFASSVLLGDLNDFITPSQACVNPIFAKSNEQEDKGSGPKLTIGFESDANDKMILEPAMPKPDLIKTSERQTAKVSLSDCLACSGCVTSAETVLIEQQSAQEFENATSSSKYELVVVTLSAQSRASLAVHFGCTPEEMEQRLGHFLSQKGVDYVLDASVAGDLALVENAHEFCHRFSNKTKAEWNPPEFSVALNSTESQLNPSSASPKTVQNSLIPQTKLPMLSSVCPGWVCFAEKSHPEAIPYISTVKSPQQIAGTLVKMYISGQSGVSPDKIYHCTVMPCADKKLEASRKDFLNKEFDSNDVDCVLTSHEVAEMMMSSPDAVMNDTSKTPHPAALASLNELSVASKVGGEVVGNASSSGGSGGYLEYVFRFAAKKLFNVTVPAGPLPFKQGRNADIHTVELHVEGKPVLKFAAAYGFRNIQSVIRQMKRGKCPYDYVEIMACPGGCLNGGGQVHPAKPDDNKITTATVRSQRLVLVDEIFHKRAIRLPEENELVAKIYREFVRDGPYSDTARRILHTRYHAIPKLENGLLEKW